MIAALEAPVQAAIVTAAGTVIVALLGLGLEFMRRSHKRIGEVREQVANSHKTNLRDDIDRVLDGIDGLRQEIRHERAERLALENRVDRLAEK
ncbi:phosphoenolpyruvate-protein kinase (PTS system EI component) [Actinoplanes campanulatus]|uniref:Phosphoenolpyruvate-protein kinase (PTS system EI component) n=1 Tax=Actinoplanes campanulatus TaxID=113559 RepID=A0A7W5AN87_9ACTN|nr:DUF2746 domain-containing protein [Actinoplanes campanulatus]MBB3099406.1 phosphoenolpyruvate-protein kinase (PTS system EI component) [Actinoplanes campanulatus]GGN40138.1 hypothetical protein GCM10010109_68800 [Actinoplanes campanulatus]GID42385.1 hypothetical protein Aca09nite_88910 [Actinoplanes campanulatus]